jgi:subtilisin family serine protease
MKKEGVVLVGLVLTCFLLVNFVSAETLTSNANVSYDSNLLNAFVNSTYADDLISQTDFIGLEIINDTIWARVSIILKDNSGIIVTGTKEERRILTKQRVEWISLETDKFLSEFPKQCIINIRKNSGGFGGFITQDCFNYLINDNRIESISWIKDKPELVLEESAILINATRVWNTWGYNGNGIKVCIIDTGIDTDQDYLEGRIAAQKCYCSNNCCPNNQDEDNSSEDEYGHGTEIAGVIASQHPTYRGISYGANLYVVRVTNDDGEFSNDWVYDVEDAINWCTDHDVNIISMSFGFGPYLKEDCPYDINFPIDLAYSYDITLVAASGNDANTTAIRYPACNGKVISVGASYDIGDGLEQTNWGDCVDYPKIDNITCWGDRNSDLDLLAPGYQIKTTPLGGGISDGDSYGTSYSAPMIAGAAALLLQKNLSLTPDEIRDVLQYTGISVYDNKTGLTFKRIDVLAAINLLSSTHLCYQESANVSTACGGLSTGRYTNDSNWDTATLSVNYAYDKSWSSHASPDTNKVASLNVNYTKPSTALNSSFLKVKDVGGTRNLPILSSCWNYNATTLMIKSVTYRGAPAAGTYGTNWSCYNGSWAPLDSADGDSLLYEEGMYWVIPTPSIW